jgi:hypothetical protein
LNPAKIAIRFQLAKEQVVFPRTKQMNADYRVAQTTAKTSPSALKDGDVVSMEFAGYLQANTRVLEAQLQSEH